MEMVKVEGGFGLCGDDDYGGM
ncbi:hypothetical protein A2U01_0099072, partial [Trifolium medium]|nr:hypothetical protein [Trifolium medium]